MTFKLTPERAPYYEPIQSGVVMLIITQTGTNNPTIETVQNNLALITGVTRGDVGEYTISFNGAPLRFEKVFLEYQTINSLAQGFVAMEINGESAIVIHTYDNLRAPSDGILTKNSIRITVLP